MRTAHYILAAGLALTTRRGLAINVNLNDTRSVRTAAQSIAASVIDLYGNPNVPGLFGPPYYWWESGLAWDSLVRYWAITGDNTYVNATRDALSFQVGPNHDYLPPNQTKSEGNDDQTFWALAAMTAAEAGFPAPSRTNVSWVRLAQNVFDSQAARWDDTTCGGGLRWQIFQFNSGYDYKNSLSNGNFLQLAARLARYTGNQTYADWATRVWEWSVSSRLVDTTTGAVYDGFSTTTNCSQLNHIQWTAGAGTYISGSAFMANFTSGTKSWNGAEFALLVSTNSLFASSSGAQGVLSEIACAPLNNCDTDQLAFKAILVRALAYARDLSRYSTVTTSRNVTETLQQYINHTLQASAQGAAAQCSGGLNATVCGSDWTNATWDGTAGLGQSLSALEVMLAILPPAQMRTVNSTGTSTTGGVVGSTTGGNSSVVNGTAPGSTAIPVSTNGAGAFVSSISTLVGSVLLAVYCM